MANKKFAELISDHSTEAVNKASGVFDAALQQNDETITDAAAKELEAALRAAGIGQQVAKIAIASARREATKGRAA